MKVNVDNVEVKWVPGYEGIYSVSADGIIYSHKNPNNVHVLVGSLMKGKNNKPEQTRRIVVLCKEGVKQDTRYVHKLVADSFIPPEDDKPYVGFVNNDYRDCSVENLYRFSRTERAIRMNNNRKLKK